MGNILCTFFTLPFLVLTQVILPVIEQVAKLVCGWVDTLITVIKTVVSQICKNMPWPLSVFCSWVTQLIEVVEVVQKWICETVITSVVNFITRLVWTIEYITRVICMVITVIIDFPLTLLCLLGISPKKKVEVCIKILTDEKGNSKVSMAAVEQNMMFMRAAFAEKCGITVNYAGIQKIVKPAYLNTTDCTFAGLLAAWHAWFANSSCLSGWRITVFFVDDIIGVSGCSYPADTFCRVDAACNFDPSVMAHEVGHLLNLPDTSDPNNIMYGAGYSATSTDLTANQCCIMKNSPYTTY